jgi:hypothetical protein
MLFTAARDAIWSAAGQSIDSVSSLNATGASLSMFSGVCCDLDL